MALCPTPVVYIWPESAMQVRELPRKPLYGPVCPNGVTEQ
jgi:hypothetical protein